MQKMEAVVSGCSVGDVVAGWWCWYCDVVEGAVAKDCQVRN